MLNTIELEARWLRYKIKSYVPYLIIFLSLVVIVTIALLYLNTQKETLDTSIEEQAFQEQEVTVAAKTSSPTPSKIEELEVKSELVELESKESSRVLAPSMEFMKEIKNSSQPYYSSSSNNKNFNEKSKIKNSRVEEKIQKPIEEIEEVVLNNTIEVEIKNEKVDKTVKEVASLKIDIKKQNIESDISGIIKRFKKNNNPALSLFIAKKYYELGDYHNAYNYALITNEINSEIEASWIVFSKSLVKLGKKEMAIKTLREYGKSTNSDSARILLDEIESGQFK